MEQDEFDPVAENAPEASVKAHAEFMRAHADLPDLFERGELVTIQVKERSPIPEAKLLRGIADAFMAPPERSLADFLAEHENLRAQVRDLAISGRSLSVRDIEQLLCDGMLKRAAPKPPEAPITVERLMEQAREVGYTEIYVAFRHRDSTKIGPDRLEDVMDAAPTLEEAMKRVIRLAGFHEPDVVKDLGLDEFGVGDLPLLCDKLKELTGDRYEICSYETPAEPGT